MKLNIRFLEPFRLAHWKYPDQRNIGNHWYIRARTFAQWHRCGKTGGKLYVSGYLLRSQVIHAAETLLALSGGKVTVNGEEVYCCPGRFDTEKSIRNEKFQLRKRHTLKWNVKDGCCIDTAPCPLCMILGRGSWKNKRTTEKTDRLVHFNILTLPGDPYFESMEEMADNRIINRVDYSTGKAHDFYRIWEVDHTKYPCVEGSVELAEKIKNSPAERLLTDSLAFVDQLCGALCVIDIQKETPCEIFPDSPGVSKDEDTVKKIIEIVKQTNPDKLGILSKAFIFLEKDKRQLDGLVWNHEGKEGHYLWDMKKDKKSIRRILKDKQQEVSSAKEWKDFCRHAADETHKAFKELQGGFSLSTRILGKRAACEIPGDDTFFHQVMPPDITETLVYGKLVAETPFFFGLESEELHPDLKVLIDREGRFRLPRSVLRGILRRDLRTALGTGCDALLGKRACNCGVCMIMKNITVQDARSDDGIPLETRTRIRINPFTGTVSEGALFDMEVGPKGTTFPFILRYRGKGRLPKSLEYVLNWWIQGMAFLGGATATGKSRFRLMDDLRIKTFELSREEERKQYLEKRGWRGREIEKAGECELFEPEKGKDFPWEKIEISVELDSPFINGDPVRALLENDREKKELIGADIVSFKTYTDAGKSRVYAYKGESFRGVVRAAVGRIAEDEEDLMKEGNKKYPPLVISHNDCDCVICRLFGSEYESAKLRFEDLTFETSPRPFLFDHVAIDRFTGGAIEKKKYDDVSLIAENKPLTLNGCVWMRTDLLNDDLKILQNAFAAIKDGLYPLGGKGGIGYGQVKALRIQGTGRIATTLQDFPEKADIKTEAKTTVPSKPVFDGSKIVKDITPNKIFYPHYFLKPHPVVIRDEKIPVGHHTLDENLLTGFIECRLDTLTPLIIPDSSDDDFFSLADKTKEEYHKSFGFLCLNGKPIIPGSSIRGMISSVFEALTNSCFRIFDEKYRLSWRMDATTVDIRKVWSPGRVSHKEKDKEGNVRFKIKQMKQYRYPFYELYGNTEQDSQNELFKDRRSYYDQPTDAERKMLSLVEPNRIYTSEGLNQKADYKIIKPNASSKADFMYVATPYNNKKGYAENEIEKPIKRKGYLKITGPNKVEKKNVDTCDTQLPITPESEDDQFVIRHNALYGDYVTKKCNARNREDCRLRERKTVRCDFGNKSCGRLRQIPAYISCKPNKDGSGKGVEYTMSKRCERVFLDEDGAEYFVTDLAVEKFETLVHEYNENAKRQETPAVFRTYLPDKTVRVGDLLYFRRKENPETGETEAVELVPVQISREVDDKYLAEHFDNKDLRPCHGTWINDEDISSLDPYPEKKLLTRHRDGLCPSCHLFGTGSYKGRIRFSVAKCKDEPVWQGGPKDSKITLPLLERPRPTWSIPNKETPVPGRKFYLHHHGWKGICKDGKQPGTETSIVPDKNNRTVKALAPQNSFVFKVHFENLRKHELGLLIWSLQLERNLAHKLGMGKPLGFGSVDICVENASLFQRKTGWENKNDQIGSWVDAGKEKMQKWFGKRWHKIDHINNLRQLLFYVEDKNPNVFYPPLENNDKTKGYKELKKEFQGKDRGKFKKMLNTPWYPWSE